jgi:hypothetical protein
MPWSKKQVRDLCDSWFETHTALFHPRTGVAVLAYEEILPEHLALVRHRKNTNALARAIRAKYQAASDELRTFALALKAASCNSTPIPPNPLEEAQESAVRMWALVDNIRKDCAGDANDRELNVVEESFANKLRESHARGVQQGVHVADLDAAAKLKRNKNDRQRRTRALRELRRRSLAQPTGRRGWWRWSARSDT